MKELVFKIWNIIKWSIIAFFAFSILSTILMRWINPPFTPLMIIRYVSPKDPQAGRQINKHWVGLSKISPHMVLAAVAAEDNKFTEHFGIDLEAIEKAKDYNERHTKRKHGASTISQQTAKNVFLWPSRSYVRKGFELYFTFLIELCWSKQRIMEVYLNIIELGSGVYGVEAASQLYFNKPAAKLSRANAAMMAAIFPNPIKRNPAKPTSYLIRRQGRILSLMGQIERVQW
jgi:monofunctional biosynthetic peptidoglycan transglycosylase